MGQKEMSTRHRYWKITSDEMSKAEFDPGKVLNWEIKGIKEPEEDAIFVGVYLYNKGTPRDNDSIKGITMYHNNVKKETVNDVVKFLKEKFGGEQKEKGERIFLEGSKELYSGKEIGGLAKGLESKFKLNAIISIEFSDITEEERKRRAKAWRAHEGTFPRQQLLPWLYAFFVANLVGFFAILEAGGVQDGVTARAFFVWVSVFNLFAVSVFWSLMADLYDTTQAQRLYGFIAAGGTAGALLGPGITVVLAVPLGPANLLLVAALLLEAAVLCSSRLESAAAGLGGGSTAPATREGLGGGWLAGILLILRSPYLAGVALWVAALSFAGTILYFQPANIVAAASDDPAVRTRMFATIDLAGGILTLLVQFFATGRLTQRFGVGAATAFLPLVLFARELLEQAGVAITPGRDFGVHAPARHVRFSYAITRTRLEGGVRRLATFLGRPLPVV